jgi:hypothetical protein
MTYEGTVVGVPVMAEETGTIAPGQMHHDVWAGKTTMSSTLPVSCEVIFDTDLPNGPYAEMNMMSAKLHVPPGSDYNAVGKALLDAWIKSRGAIMDMQMKNVQNQIGMVAGDFTFKEDWRVVSIEYRGSAVDPNSVASEGTHNVTLGMMTIITVPKLLHNRPCCTVC